MIAVNQNNLESYISDFELFLGKSFIDDANNYIENNNVGIKNCTNKKVHPFYKYWNSYINDIKNTKEHNKLHISRDTVFILELLSNIKDIKNKKNISRIIHSLLQHNTFYSAVFESQILAYYSSMYNIEIIEENQREKEKSPDFLLQTNDKNIYIECKALEDFEISNNIEYQKIIQNLSDYCQKKQKSNSIIIKTGENFSKSNTNLILSKIHHLINKNSNIETRIDEFDIEVIIQKILEWDSPMYGGIGVNHPSNVSFNLLYQMEILSNGIPEYKNLILIGIESKPILNFEKRINNEITRARKQLMHDQYNILHIQLPISNDINFEKYIDDNYNNIKEYLENYARKINAVIISNPMYSYKKSNPEIQTIQSVIIPNCRANKPIDFDFKMPYSTVMYKNIPDLKIQNNKTKIELKDIFYTQNQSWEKAPAGAILLNLVSSTAETQFKIWKSFIGLVTFDIVIMGARVSIKSTKNIFPNNEKYKIDINIIGYTIEIIVNDIIVEKGQIDDNHIHRSKL